jgi:hypothetical protein
MPEPAYWGSSLIPAASWTIARKVDAPVFPDHTRGDIYRELHYLGEKDRMSVIIGHSSRIGTTSSLSGRSATPGTRRRGTR